MKLTLGLFFILSALSLNAQNTTTIQGTWLYAEVHEKGSLSNTEVKSIEATYGEMMFHFGENNQYDIFLMGKNDQGKWALSDDGKTIVLTSDKRESSEMEIITLSQKQLIVKVHLKTFVMTRAPHSGNR